MMRTKSSFFFLLIYIFISFSLFSQSKKNWVFAAEAFETESYTANSIVVNSFAKMLPARILEKMNTTLYRTLDEDEILARELFELKKSRSSLYLQLSSEIKKRDSLVVYSYTQKELDEQIAAETQKIEEIKDKLKENLNRNKELQIMLIKDPSKESKTGKKSSMFASFFKNIFEEQPETQVEKVSFYKNDINELYNYSDTLVKKDYLSDSFEKRMVDANINALLTGKLSNFDEFYYITVAVYSYPGKRIIATASEIGTLDDTEFMAHSIARQIMPFITNSLPVELNILVETSDEKIIPRVTIDEVMYSPIPEKISLQSGVHTLQFEGKNQKTCSTSYYFEGNTIYNISVKMEESVKNDIMISLVNNYPGTLYANSSAVEMNKYGQGEIQINGNIILGEFIGENEGEGAFYYIPENKIVSGQNYNLKIKPINSSDFIEQRRRSMYTSYSILVTSLIPFYYCKGQSVAYTNANSSNALTGNQLKTANGWILASNISTGITVGCGLWFIYELVRYFMAANSALPVTPKAGDLQIKDFQLNDNLLNFNKMEKNDVVINGDDVDSIPKNGESKVSEAIEENTEGEE